MAQRFQGGSRARVLGLECVETRGILRRIGVHAGQFQVTRQRAQCKCTEGVAV